MKLLLLFPMIMFMFSIGLSQVPEINWGLGIGGNGWDASRCIVYDSHKNVYVTGSFRDTMDFDAGAGMAPLVSNGLQDTYLLKLDSLGNFLWVKQFGSTADDIGYSIVITELDEVLLTGNFNETIDFDPGIGQFLFSPTSDGTTSTGFILKLDSNGNFSWVKKMGGDIKIVLDKDKNVLVYGGFSGTKDFDPSPTTSFNLSAITSSYGVTDIFVAKLDSNFNFLWAFKYGSYLDESASGVQTDSVGNVYVVGSLRATIDFDPGPGVFNMQAGYLGVVATYIDVFFAKYSPTGNFIWAKRIGSEGHDMPSGFQMDRNANLYISGTYFGVVDFDPNAGTYYFDTQVLGGAFLAKYDSNGSFLWANAHKASRMAMDLHTSGDIVVAGSFGTTIGNNTPLDFDPGSNVFNLTSVGGIDGYLAVYNQWGTFQYAKRFGGSALEYPNSITVDDDGELYLSGAFKTGSINVGEEQNPVLYNSHSHTDDIFVLKLKRPAGVTGKVYLDTNQNCNLDFGEIPVSAIGLTIQPGNIHVTSNIHGVWYLDSLPIGNYTITINLPNNYSSNCGLVQNFSIQDTAISFSAPSFGVTSNFGFIEGTIFNDLNANCIKDAYEPGIPNRLALIQPGNQVVQTNSLGYYKSDTLAIGNYSITVDTNGNWGASCINTFTVNNVPWGGPIIPTNIGLISAVPCARPLVSINSSRVRPCFNGSVNVHAKNLPYATASLTNAYVIVEMDSLINIISASMPYTNLGNGQYRVDLGTLNPGQESIIQFYCHYSCQMIVGRTYCFDATLYPINSCVYDTVPASLPPDFSPCTLPWDHSSLSVDGYCQNDSIYFSVTNNGLPGYGDMDCYSPVRIYIDGSYILMDSVQLAGGETSIFSFSADGRTWRFEADQHPLHPGNSHPNFTIEACGNLSNWTPNLVNLLPPDDADQFVDIECVLARLSYDPNVKTGYPLGVGTTNNVSSNGQIDYVIDFQNTGTDTAFTVVIRDTLEMDLDIFTVQSGVSSHPYSFVMHGPRVLEWTFSNILLPDSTTNENASHGFVTFTVNQNQNLANGTQINNRANIYFDFNEAIVTNTTNHTIQEDVRTLAWIEQDTVNVNFCGNNTYSRNGITYSNSGTYFQLVEGDFGIDTLVKIIFQQNLASSSTIMESVCSNYIAPDNQVYSSSGIYSAIIPNTHGCDSLITIDLTVLHPTSSTINETRCSNYTTPDGQVYTSSGMYSAMIPNTQGCDSLITIDLTILHPTSSTINETRCSNYTAPDGQVYTSSGMYTALISNTQGCDSLITIDLTVLHPTSSTITETTCSNYTAPDGQVYTSSGIYTALISNTQGCDSIITIDLTIVSIIPTITNNSPSLHADMDNAAYQWLDCSNSYMPIAGETNQNFTATTNGLYAVQINLNSCLDTSDCFLITGVGLEHLSDELIKLYPNPSNGEFTVDFGILVNNAGLFVEDITGRIVYESDNITDQKVDLKLKEAPGAYYVIIKFASGEIQKLKLILE
ncbi:MAG: T9SS type A sorting domain-containing protein [Fluviicola sp.]|nr:T9SS type A sorting domain-containing protein [Fluviicola sp.]